MNETVDDQYLDGNAAGGLLGELFGLEITTAITVCEGCGEQSPVGGLRLYGHRMGAVLRCPACNQLMMVVTRPHDEWWIDLRGVRLMQILPSHRG